MSGRALRDIPEEEIFNLIDRLEARGPRYTSYPTVPVWKDSFPTQPFESALARLGIGNQPIAVYIHLPFCRSRCLYCGCNSYITHDAGRMQRYGDALCSEIDRISGHLSKDIRHSQLHLGGGTPTQLAPDLLARILDRILERIPGIENPERSIEVDPRVTTGEHLQMLAARGFTRISAGLQDFNPDVQRAVNREYSLSQMRDFMDRARQHGFTSVNMDLIYGLPLQTRETWQETLKATISLKPDRVATFGYAHLPSRIKHQQAIREADLPKPHQRLGMMLDAQRYFPDAGYVAIGMDHFAQPNDDLAIASRERRVWRNFMGYTTSHGMELLGIGCSAISEFQDLFVQNITPPEAYVEAIQSGKWAVQRGHQLDEDDRIRKHIINHLMCNLDVRIPAQTTNNNGLAESLHQAMTSLRPYVQEGLLEEHAEGYTVTPLGQLFLRNLAMPFDRYLNGQSESHFSKTV